MRKILALLLISISTYSYDIQVENYFKTNMDFIFVIEDHNYEKVTLDCQGFINGVKIKQLSGAEDLFQLGYGDCAEIHTDIMRSLANKLPICLQLYMDKGKYTVQNKFCKI